MYDAIIFFFSVFRFIFRNIMSEKRRLAFLLFHGKTFANSFVRFIFVLFQLSLCTIAEAQR